MKIKIITLNLWRYYDWDLRKNKIIQFIRNQNPDIICVQEANKDPKFGDKGENQVEQIANEIGYDSHFFSPVVRLTKWHKEPLDREVWMGDGIISKFPIIKKEGHKLMFYERDKKPFGFASSTIKINDKEVDVLSVHFANNDLSSELHLKETMDWCEKKKIYPIIAGDFNFIDTKKLIEITDKDYILSYKIKKYLSFMPTEHSNNKVPITLDYIAIHKNKFSFDSIECVDADLSDHWPVVAEIKIL